MSSGPSDLRAVLERAQQVGSLGPGDVDAQIAHSLDFASCGDLVDASRCIDLGSGGGVPGLPLALAHPETTWVLIDAWQARCDQLDRAVRALGLEHRVGVQHARAEDAGRDEWRRWADLVVARSFAAPAITAECAAPLLRDGGVLVVSVVEAGDAWPSRVPQLGLESQHRWSTSSGAFASFRRRGATDPHYPRRPAAQRRRPLF